MTSREMRTFNDEQKIAISHGEGAMIVIAGPGSGKTTVITNRIKYLIESAGVLPADILVITFTRAAAEEMEQRFRGITEGKNYPVRFGTFHSIFFWIIKTAYNLNNSCVISEEEKRQLIENYINKMSIDYDNKEDVVSSVISQISFVKCDMISIDNYYSKDMPETAFRDLYHYMEKELKRLGKMDFDDMMVICYELLKNRPDILNRCRDIFKYILVDEFQDSNKLQYEIFKMLALPRGNAFIVGDDDQSVYGFRGARPEIMQQFMKDFPNVKEVLLGTNYRCAEQITNASAHMISKNKNRFLKQLQSYRKNDGIIKIIEPKDGNDENRRIIEQIRENYNLGIPYEQQAVLYRTNIQPRRLVYKLDQYNIPYSISESMPNIFDHFVVRNILDYFYVSQGDYQRARVLRIINKPGRYISRDSLMEDPVDFDKLRFRLRNKDYVVENLDKFLMDLRFIKKMRPYPALNFIRKSIGFDDYLKEYAQYRQMDSGELMDVLDEFASMIVEISSYDELFEFMEDYSEVMKKQKKQKNRTGVNLMTMHGSKGLEFACVYILDAVEGVTPYKKAKTVSELEEERRMFYVAMTRAEEALYIYSPKEVTGHAVEKSPYVKDIMMFKTK